MSSRCTKIGEVVRAAPVGQTRRQLIEVTRVEDGLVFGQLLSRKSPGNYRGRVVDEECFVESCRLGAGGQHPGRVGSRRRLRRRARIRGWGPTVPAVSPRPKRTSRVGKPGPRAAGSAFAGGILAALVAVRRASPS